MPFKTLYILRHAKAAPQEGAQDDHDRPLTERGERDAYKIGEYMREVGISPGHVLCSTSLRTRQTLQALERGMDRPLATHFDGQLYLASPRNVLDVLSREVHDKNSVLIIGHNPTLHQLTNDLVDSGEQALMDELSAHFPTACLAEIHYPAEDWHDIGPKRGTLKRLVSPMHLTAGMLT